MGCDEKRKIAVVIANMNVEYASEIRQGIMQEARARSFDVYLFNARVNADETLKYNQGQYNIYNLINLERFDGVIVFSNLLQGRRIYEAVEKSLRDVEIPVVGIDAPIGEHHYVGVENYQSMKAIVEHFIEHHKFTKINYISGQSFNSDSQLRLKAYCDAMEEHGLPVEQKRIFPGVFTFRHGRNVANQMMASGQDLPQAIVCGNDDIAIGLVSELKKYGVRVPEDVAVSGFDNRFHARNSVPRITTVDRALKSLGKEAVIKIDALLENSDVVESEMFPTVPVFAGSCGCNYDDGENIDSVRKEYLAMVDQYENHINEINTMIEELNDSKTLDDFLIRLRPYVENLECDRFYLCLDKAFVDDMKGIKAKLRTKGYSKMMTVPFAYEFGAFTSYDDFPSEWMLPWEDAGSGGNHTYVFEAIHFRDAVQGYVIVENCDTTFHSPLFKRWLINLSGGLENLRKQEKLKYMIERLDKLYVVDSLTDLYNRFGFTRYSADKLAKAIQNKSSLMILFADLDGLKKINDIYGHDRGDVAIKAVADALKAACTGEEICARFGGDEYVVLAPDYDEKKAKEYCERFDAALVNYNQTLGQPFTIEASYGYELVTPIMGELIDKYIDMADQKMYLRKKAKYAGRDA